MNKVKNWFFDLFKGIAIGISCIIPGVSGGTIALLTKIYDKLIEAISTLFKNFVKSFLVLLPVGIGVIIGLLVGYLGIRLAFQYILFSIVSLFFGFILGSVPDLCKEISDEPIKPSYIITLVVTQMFVIGLSLASFLIELHEGYSVESLFMDPKWYLYLIMIPIGVIASFALVAPGISGSMLLLILGFYSPILNTIHSLVHLENVGQNIGLLLCFLLGVLVGFFFVSKLMKYLLDKHKTITYYGIIGFVIASLPSLFLNVSIWRGDADYVGIINNPIELALAIPLLIAGALITYFILRYISKKKKRDLDATTYESEQ